MAVAAARARLGSVLNAALKPAMGGGAAAAAGMPDAVVTVTCTLNNMHVTVSNLEGQIVAKSSGGLVGFKHRERAGRDAGTAAGEMVAKKAFEAGYRVAHVHVKGPSRGRGSVLRGIQVGGLRVFDIRDMTPMPTNGCRPPHKRRL